MVDFKPKLKEKLNAKCSESLYKRTFSVLLDSCFEVDEIKLDSSKQITFVNGDEISFLCKVCLSYLQKGKMPPKAAVNCLKVVPVPENIRLRSYLEEALIARVLLFIKIFALRTSLMPAMKDQCVVIPLSGSDILNTVESLPRLPSESGILDIHWKRRIQLKTTHLQAKVDPNRLFNALEFLKKSGNKYYEATQTLDEFKSKCNLEDPDGYNLIFGDDHQKSPLQIDFFPDDSTEPILELPTYLYLNEQQKNEEEFK